MALCFSLIVMYDAAGVRRHAGTQAEVLNLVVKELLQKHAVSQRKLKEVLGHTPLQVRSAATEASFRLHRFNAEYSRPLCCVRTAAWCRAYVDSMSFCLSDDDHIGLTAVHAPQVCVGAMLGVFCGFFYATHFPSAYLVTA